jgi:tryptophan 2,3-dioxygenase
MSDEDFRRNILWSANYAWRELLRKGDTYVIKKVEPRDTFSQLLYKVKKIFSDERAPENALKIVRKADPAKPWYQASSKHKKVYVRVEAIVCPLQGNPRLDAPHIYAAFEEKPVPLAKLTVYVQAKHFYDDQAPHECHTFTEQVREKFGPYPGRAHISSWQPTKALDRLWLKKFYKQTLKIDDLDKALEDFIDLDQSADDWRKKHWNTDMNDPAGA